MIRILLMSSFIFLLTLSVVVAEPAKPRWTLELNGGFFQPEDDNWKNEYEPD